MASVEEEGRRDDDGDEADSPAGKDEVEEMELVSWPGIVDFVAWRTPFLGEGEREGLDSRSTKISARSVMDSISWIKGSQESSPLL